MERLSAVFRKLNIRWSGPGSSGQEALQYDLYEMRLREVVIFLLLLLAGTTFLSFVFYDSFLPGVILLPVLLLLFSKKAAARMIERRRRFLKRAFLTEAGLLCSSLKSGLSIENAVMQSEGEIAEMYSPECDMAQEIRRMQQLFRFNVTAEEAFTDFAERSGIPEIMDFSEVFSLVKRTGGQVGEALSIVTEVLTEEFEADEEIRTTLASKRTELRIMDLMPAGILFYVKTASPELLEVMYRSSSGRLIMTVCLAVYAAVFIWGERILAVES